MKLLVLLSIMVASITLTTISMSAEVIRMGYFMLPPHTFNDGKDGAPQGAGIEYFNNVARKMGYTVEWIGPLPLPRLTEFLRTGKVDGTIGFPKFSMFEKFLHYADGTVYMAQPSLGISSRQSLSAIKTIHDIRGFRIGFIKSKSGKTTPLIDKNRAAIHLREFHGNKWMEQNVKMVNMGRLDALYDRQEYTMRYIAARFKLDKKIKVLPMPSKARPMYIAFSRMSPRGGEKLLKLCNQVQPAVKVDYLSLLQKEFELLNKK